MPGLWQRPIGHLVKPMCIKCLIVSSFSLKLIYSAEMTEKISWIKKLHLEGDGGDVCMISSESISCNIIPSLLVLDDGAVRI